MNFLVDETVPEETSVLQQKIAELEATYAQSANTIKTLQDDSVTSLGAIAELYEQVLSMS
jgi:uncharacterized coiled-coil protein SlyX